MDVKLPVSPEILKPISQIDHFRGVWAGGAPVGVERLEALRAVARTQSVASSCRIAGVRATDAEVAAVLAGDPGAAAQAAELSGYAKSIDGPFPRGGPLVTVEEIASLNAVLMGKP